MAIELDIKKALIIPLKGFGKNIGVLIIFLLAVGMLFGSIYLRRVIEILELPIPTGAISGAQAGMFVFGVLFYIAIIGFISRLISHGAQEKLPKLSLIKSIGSGSLLALVLLVYFIPYRATFVVHGLIGVILTLFYIIIMAIFLPAIVVTNSHSLFGGFKWGKIIKTTLSKNYLTAYLVAAGTILVYGGLVYGISAVSAIILFTVADNIIVYGAVVVGAFALSVLLAWMGLATISLLFAQTTQGSPIKEKPSPKPAPQS